IKAGFFIAPDEVPAQSPPCEHASKIKMKVQGENTDVNWTKKGAVNLYEMEHFSKYVKPI
ncbi:MAG TPA: hypothetical protein VIX91_21310, partial [Candidatus Acidoferrum sp.]